MPRGKGKPKEIEPCKELTRDLTKEELEMCYRLKNYMTEISYATSLNYIQCFVQRWNDVCKPFK